MRIRSNAVIVQNSSILLAKIDAPTRPDPIWMPPGGGVDLGETLEEAVVRELKEETGLIVEIKQLCWIHEFVEEPFHAIEFYFWCTIVGGELKKGFDPELQPEEQMLLDLSFVPLQEAAILDLNPDFLREFCRQGGEFPKNVRHVVSESS